MKKLFVWATMAALLVAGSALAAGPVTSLNAGRMFIQPNATFAPPASFGFGAAGAAASGPTTTNNDDSCDISTMPAATLLLPYFEVDFRSPSTSAINTNFTITNVSAFPQIAHITVWTDRSFPVLDFNIFLTGYDVQGINLYDIIARGQIPPTGAGTVPASTTGFPPNSPIGSRSNLNNSNPNLNNGTTGAGIFAACASLAGAIPGAPAAGSTTATGLLLDIQNALSRGTYSLCPTGTPLVGNDHGATGLATGYVTVDVANTCSTTLPTTSTYYTNEILFDNVLIGDYQRINPVASGSVSLAGDAGGNPMVHIRAIPEGGPATGAGVVAVNLPFTFYDRYTPATSGAAPLGRKSDRRQPLPGVFAARYISGGTGTMDTRVNIWREGVRNGTQTEACTVSENAAIPTNEVVRFDEHENPSAFVPQGCQVSPCGIPPAPAFFFPEASSNAIGVFPTLVTADVGGWLYLNLNNGGNTATSAPARTFLLAVAGGTHLGASQNWVSVTHSAATSGLGRFSVEFDAAALGNGCSGNPGVTSPARGGSPAIGPLGGAVIGTNTNP